MDGDLRPRFRRIGGADATVPGWGYSATIQADLGHPQTATPRPSTPSADIDRPDRQDGRERERTQPTGKRTQPGAKPNKDADAGAKQDDATPAKPPMSRGKKILYWAVGLVILATLIIAGTLYYLNSRHYETTDDAFIDGYTSQVSAQVAAKVINLAVKDNQRVNAGATLLQLDPRDYQVRVEQAQAQRAQANAQLLQAQAGLQQMQANIDQAEANVRVNLADLGQQQTDLARYRAIDPKAITRQQLDATSAQTKSAAARVDASKQAVEAARAQFASQKAQVEAAAANLKAADVAVANAQLQLSYTTVSAPDTGRVTRRTVDLGNYVSPGQSLLAIVPEQVWVTANYKESQLAAMKPGQPVRIQVDACPGHDFAGHVDSFQSGTGAVFSSLPAENATGNYVKVVQRVPVKITFDQQPTEDVCRLYPGLSVAPRVTVR